jgi:hypothetical protein
VSVFPIGLLLTIHHSPFTPGLAIKFFFKKFHLVFQLPQTIDTETITESLCNKTSFRIRQHHTRTLTLRNTACLAFKAFAATGTGF